MTDVLKTIAATVLACGAVGCSSSNDAEPWVQAIYVSDAEVESDEDAGSTLDAGER